MRCDCRSHDSVSSGDGKDRYASYHLFPMLRCRHISGREVAAVVDGRPHRLPTYRRPGSLANAGTSVRQFGGRSMGGALGAVRLYRSLCSRHARWPESKIARDSHATQRSELLHVSAASPDLSLDADRLVSEYREGSDFLSVVCVSADHRNRRMAWPERLLRIFATA